MKKAFKTTMAAMVLGTSSLGLSVGTASADQLILDDLIVDGSLCVGQDCVNGESFGFDTIRLKENNLRIRAVDTSSSASFPTNDWQITFNDSSNGGANKFSIEDIDGGRIPFTIEASAPSNALYVDDGGRIGFGKNTPVVELHVADGDTPTLRLEQDGSSGFAAQTWDVAGNETNFFIRDVSNGSTLPLRVRPGAPTSAIDIAADGDIGIGTASPANAMHLLRSDGSAVLKVEDNSTSAGNLTMLALDNAGGRPRIQLTGAGAANQTGDWSISAGNTFVLQDRTDSQNVMIVDQDGNMTLTGGLTTSGSCSIGCDRVFDASYDLPSITEHTTTMWQNGYLPNVGPTAEDGPFNVSDKMGRMLNELEHAHIYIGQLHERLAVLEEQLSD